VGVAVSKVTPITVGKRWDDYARAIVHEEDPKKLAYLVKQLKRLLDRPDNPYTRPAHERRVQCITEKDNKG